MKRLLPLGVLLLLASGAHAATTAKPRCPGMADLEKALAAKAMTIPADASKDFTNKSACGQEVWNYIIHQSKEQKAFNSLDGDPQLDIIKKYAKQFEEIDALVAKLGPLVEAYRAEVKAFRDPATKAKKKLELLPRIISSEGEQATLMPTQKSDVVEGGFSFASIRQAISAVAAHELLKKHGASPGDPFDAAHLRRLWEPKGVPPLNSKYHAGAFKFVDWGKGQEVWDHYKAALDILNGVNNDVRGKDKKGTVRELRVVLMYEAMNSGDDKEDTKDPKDAKPDVGSQGDKVSGELAAFKDAFEKKASAEIFDGLKRGIDNRKNLPADDPKHLTEAQAKKAYDEIHAQYKDAKAEVQGDKIAMVITDKEGRKVKLSETLVPKELTVTKAEELGAKVGREIITGNEFKATYMAVIASILGDEVPKDHVKHEQAKPSLVGPTGGDAGGETGGPTGFAKDVANADCGGITDIGKNDQTLALKARNKDIAKLSAEYSKARAGVMKAHDQAILDAKEAYDAKIASVDAQAAKERENPFFTDFEGQAARVAASKAEAKKVYEAAVKAANDEQAAAFKEGGSVGTEEQVKTKASALEKEKNEQVRAYYKEQVAARVDGLWASYKKRDRAKLSSLAMRLGSREEPMPLSYISTDLLDGFFKSRYGEKDVREKNLAQVTLKIGVPNAGNITGSLPSIDEVDEIVEDELEAHFKKIMKEKAAKKKAWEESQKKKQ